MSTYEIERKFLMHFFDVLNFVKNLGVEYRSELLEQYYISSKTEPYARFRKKEARYYKTIKKGEGLVRQEIENQITMAEYESHRTAIIGRLITKTRYTFDYQNFTYELDSFSGSLTGLIYLEIEFADEEQAKEFELPKLFEQLLYREVTEESTFSNYALSTLPYIPSPTLSTMKLDAFSASSVVLVSTIERLIEEIERSRTLLEKNPHDVEALHNFRVAIRKVRAILGSFRGVMSKSVRKSTNTTLSQVMQQTNKKRDNDVAVMTFTQLRDESPKALREPITLILDFYQKREKKLTKKLAKLIGSDEVQDMLEMILAIKVEDRLFKKVANQPIILTALEVVKNHFDMIVKSGEKIDMSSDDNVYHKIRIAFKKLRYTLDLLTFMTDESKMELFLTDLKSIQTTLGDMHDIQIQRSEIEKIMLNFGENKEFTILLKNMDREEKKLKQQFLKDFKSFAHKKMSYDTLFFKKL